MQASHYSADRRVSAAVLALRLLLNIQFVHHTKGLQELIEVYAAVLIIVDAARQAFNGIVAHGHAEVRAEQLPGLLEFFNGNET